MIDQLPEFYAKLRFQQRLLLILLAILWGFTLLGIFSLVVLGANVIDAASPIREAQAWSIVSITAFSCFAFGVIGLVLLFLRRPDTLDLARTVETRFPQLRETLSTAVELQEKQGGPANPLEEALFRQVERETADINIRRASLPRILHPLGIIAIIGLAMILSDYAANATVAQKARLYRMDQLTGQATGLIVEPGQADVPRGGDLRVTATVTRWQKNPVIIQRQADGSERSFPMMPREGDVFELTLYDLTHPISYRVETSSLQSPWFDIVVYDPPVFERISLQTTPPTYTREDPAQFSRLIDLHVPEGSTITIDLTTGADITASLNLAGERLPFSTAESGQHRISFTALHDGDYQVTLRNAEGRTAISQRFAIKVIPDQPPAVDIVEPGRDSSVRPDGAVPLSIFSTDDYGLTRVELHLSISGLPRPPIVLFQSTDTPPREREILSAIQATDLLVEHGDVIAYHAVAWDNRTPSPQSSRSEMFFIEVLTDVPEQDQDENASPSGEGSPPEEINLRAVIVELKRLIRQSHAAEPLTGQRRADTLHPTGADLAAVKNEAREILSKIGSVLLQVEGGAFFDFYRNSLVLIDDAERLVNNDSPGQAIPPLSEALSKFVLIESYLKSLSQTEQNMGGGGESSQSSSSSGSQGQQQEQSSQTSASMDPAQMQQMLEQINNLVDQQAAQNQSYRQADGRNLGEQEREQLSQAQQKIADKLQDTVQQLRHLEESYPIRQLLQNAGREMNAAGNASSAGNAGQAERAGLRAREGLIEAASLLDDRIREAASGSIVALAQQAQALAERQEQARSASEQAQQSGSGDSAAMRRQQEQLRQQWDQLIAQAQREAVNLGSVYPEAAQALARATRDASQANTAGEMQRAANALLYERYGTAARHQGEASQQLNQLANSLGQALGELPPMSPTELRRLLEQIEATRQSLAQNNDSNDGSQSGSRLQRTADALASAGQALNNQNLVELGENLQASQNSSGGVTQNSGITSSLDHASRILQEYLRSRVIDQRLRLNRDSAPPPEKYRTLVEEYFKNLANE